MQRLQVVLLYEHKHKGRFSNIHQYTFKCSFYLALAFNLNLVLYIEFKLTLLMIVNKYHFDDNNKTLSRPWKFKCSFKILLLIYLIHYFKWITYSYYIKILIQTIILLSFLGLLTDGKQKDPHIKICHTYPAIMKFAVVIPYIKKIQKIYKIRDTLLAFC